MQASYLLARNVGTLSQGVMTRSNTPIPKGRRFDSVTASNNSPSDP